jgi:hypothetical protein
MSDLACKYVEWKMFLLVLKNGIISPACITLGVGATAVARG